MKDLPTEISSYWRPVELPINKKLKQKIQTTVAHRKVHRNH